MKTLSISRTQYTLKEQEIIQRLLKSGVEPNTFEVSNRVREHFDSKIPGLPYYTPAVIKAHETSDPKAWNEMFKNLNTDLDIVYKTNVDQNNRIMTMEEYYLSEKEKVAAKLDKLQLRLTNLQDGIQSGKASQNFCQTFDSFYNIDFDGNVGRNIPYTTSFVDLAQKKVYSDKLSRARDKKDITKSTMTINPISPFIDIQDGGDITSTLKDTINEFYIYNLRTPSNTETNVKVDITFPDVITISSVVLVMTSSRSISGTLSISEDGTNFTELYTVTDDSIMEWNFDSTPVKFLKIILSKQEADGYDSGIYEYYFVLKNISAISESFVNNSTYVSKPMVFADTIDTVIIKSDDLVFPRTNINYFIGLDDGVNKINWQFAENGVPCSLSLLTSKTKIINKGLAPTDKYGEYIGHGCYRICKLPDNVNMNSLQLKPGYQMWHAESLDLYKANNHSASFDPEFYTLNIDDYMRKDDTPVGTIDNEEYRWTMRNGVMHVLTQYVFCEEESILSSKFIKYVSTNGSSDIKLQCIVLINNIEINPSSTDEKTIYNYNLRLKQGRNKVQIIMFPNTKDKLNESSTIKIEHNLNFKECSFDVFTAPQMKLTSIHSLRYRVFQSNDKYYAIDELGYIVVKYNPLSTFTAIVPSIPVGEFDAEERQMRYLLKYKALSAKGANKVTFRNGTPNVKFRIMATLLSSREDISPQILSYRIIGQ